MQHEICKAILDDRQQYSQIELMNLTLFQHTRRELFFFVSHYGNFSDGDIEISLIGVKSAQSKSLAGQTYMISSKASKVKLRKDKLCSSKMKKMLVQKPNIIIMA